MITVLNCSFRTCNTLLNMHLKRIIISICFHRDYNACCFIDLEFCWFIVIFNFILFETLYYAYEYYLLMITLNKSLTFHKNECN